jgi:polyisoprenoid-binding protein YceI
MAASWALHAAHDAYQIDAAQSRVTIAVGKSGAFSFAAGHAHEVSGPIQSGSIDVDPDDPTRSHVRLVIDATALRVTGANEPPDDRPKVQEAMESEKVLDAARFPHISFESTAVSNARRTNASLDAVVAGQLTIRDVKRPVSVPVHVDLAGATLKATGRFPVKQTEFGIKPISVGGGAVQVKDTLDIAFTIVALRAPADPSAPR